MCFIYVMWLPFYGNYVTENQITTSKLKRFESKRFLYIFLLDFFFAYFRDNKLTVDKELL